MYKNIFDSHSHYDDKSFNNDLDEVLKKLPKLGVSNIIHAAIDIKSCEFGILTSKKYDFYYTSVGIHPENVEKVQDDYILKLEKFCENEKVVAIGEIGLDYYWTKETKQKQLEVFEEQIKLAKKLDLPIIVHCREATNDCMTLLRKYKPKGVVHCFSGSVETAKEVLDIGMYISFTGVLTFPKSEKAKAVVKMMPIDKLLLETDCPFMAPVPNRGKRCTSDMIAYVAEVVSQLKGIDTQEVLDITNKNAKTLFKIN